MPRSKERYDSIASLRQLAQEFEVTPCSRNAVLEDVEKMVKALRKKRLNKKQRESLESAYLIVAGPSLDSATAAEEQPAVQPAEENKRRLRGRSFLFTYNWHFFGRCLPDGTSPFGGVAQLWKEWKTALRRTTES